MASLGPLLLYQHWRANKDDASVAADDGRPWTPEQRARRAPERERRAAIRAETYARLDGPERMAWEAWCLVSGQGRLFREDHKQDHHAIVIPLDAFDRACDWLDVPRAWRARAWRGVLMLNDHAHHEGRGQEAELACFHGADVMAEKCSRCRARWRCRACGAEFVVHDPCVR